MNTALQTLGVLLVIDFIGVLMLFACVALIGRRERRFSPAVLLGPMIFLALGMAIVYGALWLWVAHWRA